MHVEKTKSILDLICVIGESDLAYRAFATLMYNVRETYGIVRIHGLSHFELINRKIPVQITQNYIYVYNECAPRMQGKDSLFI